MPVVRGQCTEESLEAQPVLGATTALSYALKRCGALSLDVGFCVAALQSSTLFLQEDTHTSFYGRHVWRGGPATKSWCSGKSGRLTSMERRAEVIFCFNGIARRLYQEYAILSDMLLNTRLIQVLVSVTCVLCLRSFISWKIPVLSYVLM